MKTWQLGLGLLATICVLPGCDSDSPSGSGTNSGSTSSDPSSTGDGSVTITTATVTATNGNTMTGSATAADSSSSGTDSATGSEDSTTGDTGDTGDTGSSDSSSSSSTGEQSICESTSPYDGPGECDPYAQDCPDGLRCVPWANDGGTTWNSTRCSVLEDEPDQLGDPCTVTDSGVSGVDSCDAGLMCFDVDIETDIGECISLCECGPEAPVCAQAGAFCAVSNQGSLPICLSPCDPLLPDSCNDGSGCYPIDDSFVCAPDASGVSGAQGDACGNINTCDPGLLCANDVVPDCGGPSCCTAVCPLDGVDECGLAAECIPWFAEGMAPPQYENVGICALPA